MIPKIHRTTDEGASSACVALGTSIARYPPVWDILRAYEHDIQACR